MLRIKRNDSGNSRGSSVSLFKKSCAVILMAGMALTAMLLPGGGESRAATGEGRMVVELAGASWWQALDTAAISGLNGTTRQAYKYSRERHGSSFHYVVDGLTQSSYDLEFSCVDTESDGAGKRVFDISVNGISVVNDLDLYSRSGKSVAWQTTAYNRVPTDGVLDIGFAASEGEATISTIRFISEGETVLELAASENRRWSTYPLRMATSADQDVHEVALGRMGTRFFINPVPQLLGWRQSALGTFTEDLGELALAFREEGGR